jgi:hypothetical protein
VAKKVAAHTEKTGKAVGSAGRSVNRRTPDDHPPQHALKAEWLAGIALMWLLPFVQNTQRTFNAWVARQMLWTLVFIILLLLSAVGPRAGRVSAAFGGLSLLLLLMTPFQQTTYGISVMKKARAMVGKPPKENVVPNTNMSDWVRQLLDMSPKNKTTGPPETAPPLPLPQGVIST